MATSDRGPPSHLSAVVRPRPTGRYIYESSSDEDGEDGEVWPRSSRRFPLLDSDASSDEGGEPTSHARRDVASIRLANEMDPWDQWELTCRERAWKPVHRARSVAPSTGLTPAPDAGVDEINTILAKFQLQQQATEKKEREAFEKRNATLWEGIEAAIRQAEQRAAQEAEQLAEARRKQERAEAEAKRAREAELQRIEDEKKAAAARKQAEEARQREAEAEAAKAKAQNVFRGGEHVWAAAKDEYEHWQARMAYIKTDILPSIAQRPDWRKQCFTAKRAITPKVGQLTNSRAEIVRITAAIGAVLQQARDVPDKEASERLYYWCLNHLAKCLIRQAEQEVAARQETAFPLARLVLGLFLQGHTALGDVLMARLVKKCVWVLAYLPPRGSMDEAEHRRRLGFKPWDESAQSYASRMTGICALYFACLQTPLASVADASGLPAGQSLAEAAKPIPSVFRPLRLWVWQVRAMTPPMAEQAFIVGVWCTFLEVAGPCVCTRYGRQGAKMWSLLLDEGVAQAKLGAREKDDAQKAALVRLQLMLETWRTTQPLGAHVSRGREMDP